MDLEIAPEFRLRSWAVVLKIISTCKINKVIIIIGNSFDNLVMVILYLGCFQIGLATPPVLVL